MNIEIKLIPLGAPNTYCCEGSSTFKLAGSVLQTRDVNFSKPANVKRTMEEASSTHMFAVRKTDGKGPSTIQRLCERVMRAEKRTCPFTTWWFDTTLALKKRKVIDNALVIIKC